MLPPPDAEPSEMLVAVGRVLALDLPLEEAMRRVTRLVTRAFGADMGGAYFLDAAREALAPLAGYHVPRDLMETLRQTPFPIARFAFLREARRTGEAVWTADYAGDPRFDQDFLASYRPRALLFVPTTLRGEIVGGLFLAWWTEARRFAPEELRLAAAVASQVSLTLEKADLIRRMQEQLRETEILAELAKSINAALDLDVVLQRVAEGARELTRSDQSTIALRDAASQAMRFRYWSGAAYEGYPALRIEPGKGSGGQVLATGRPGAPAADPLRRPHLLPGVLRAQRGLGSRLVLGGAVQDAEVPAGVPRALRLDPGRASPLPRLLSLVQPPSTIIRASAC
jgi:GAF domain-containing protein